MKYLLDMLRFIHTESLPDNEPFEQDGSQSEHKTLSDK